MLKVSKKLRHAVLAKVYRPINKKAGCRPLYTIMTLIPWLTVKNYGNKKK